jgi:hypothetical protein
MRSERVLAVGLPGQGVQGVRTRIAPFAGIEPVDHGLDGGFRFGDLGLAMAGRLQDAAAVKIVVAVWQLT